MRNIFCKNFAAIASVCVTGAAIAGGHSGTPAEVKARIGLMDNYSLNLGILGAMAKGERDYDAAIAKIAAANLVYFASSDQSLLWPEGTDSDAVADSRALPVIWQKGPDVFAKSQDLMKAATALAETSDLDGLRAAIGPVGSACGACHKAYRKPK